MATSVIEFSTAWQKDHSIGYKCEICEDDIFGETYAMKIITEGKIVEVKKDLPHLCPSCFDLLKSEVEGVILIE